MRIFSKHRKKMEAHRRFGSREFQNKLESAKNYKRSLHSGVQKNFFSDFFTKTGLSKAGTFAAIVVLLVLFYFLVISPYFLITEVQVSGNTKVGTEQMITTVSSLSEKRFFLVPQNSFFLLSEGRLNNVVQKKHPIIAKVETKRQWPNKISINVTERNEAFVFVVRGQNYLVDDQGFVITTVDASTPHMKVIDSLQDDELAQETTISGKLVPFIISMQKMWPEKINLGINEIKIPGLASQEVEFVSDKGWSVFFSIDRPVVNQLNNLALLLNRQIPASQKTNLAYIDLRIAKWAYYCFKSTPCQQSDQEALASEATAGTKIETDTAKQLKPEAQSTDSKIQNTNQEIKE